MRTHTASGALAAALLLAATSTTAAPKGKVRSTEGRPAGHTVTHWLVLGPVSDALPLFHEEDRGRYSVDALLNADRGPSARTRPVAGESVPWPGSAASVWAARDVAKDGRIALATDATNDGKGYASAWLASYLQIDRFGAFDVEVTGSHPRRLWVDGEPVASGGLAPKEGEPGSPVKGTVKLEQGTHVLLVETIYDPVLGAPWVAGAVLSPSKPEAGVVPIVSDSAQAARDLTLSDVLDAPQITSVAVSADGTLVAAGICRVIPGSDDVEAWVEVRQTAGGALVRSWRGGTSIGQVAWSPAGRKLSYVARDRREAGRDSSTLWLADVDSGAVTPVVERVENFAGYDWAPGGASIVYAATSKADPDKRGVKLRQNLLDRQAGWRDKTFLYQVSVPGGATRRLTAGGLTASLQDFSPDGTRLLLLREVEDTSARPFTRKEIWELSLETLQGKKLRDSGWASSVRYAPDGRRLLIVSGPSEFGDLGLNVPQGMTPNESDGQVYVLDPATGQADALSRDFDPAILSAFWSRFDGTIYVKAAARDRAGLFRYDASAKRFVPLEAGGPVVSDLAFAENAAVAACAASGPWTPESLWAVDLGGGPARRLDAPAAAALAGVRTGPVVPFPVRTSRGTTIDGRVYLPPGYTPSGRYPAIVNYYGGTLPVSEEFGGRYPKEWWAAHGYVVYVPQPSGATGYGQAFSAAHVNDWGATVSDEILEATRAFLAAYPAVDPKRVGCIGASYGGFMTMLLVTKTDQFAAAVSHAGISNIAAYWGEGYWGYTYGALATADSFPWNRKDVYVGQSPIFAADKVKTPILLTHGATDTNVPPGESESFYTALKLMDAPVELLTVDGQDHHIIDHAKRLVWSRSILAWFDRWLKGQPAWWDDLYPKTQVK